ncbi:MAG: hypothetical protein IH784_05800 [Bacteroidetes bacterium]|nr:hypothetical protein [Bacteroidota bacterium]
MKQPGTHYRLCHIIPPRFLRKNVFWRLTPYFLYQFTDTEFIPILKNFSKKNLAGIISFKREDAENIFNYLQTKNIVTAVREGIVRLSPHFYNTKDEIDKVVAELKNY